jgi:hypothetical protein
MESCCAFERALLFKVNPIKMHSAETPDAATLLQDAESTAVDLRLVLQVCWGDSPNKLTLS